MTERLLYSDFKRLILCCDGTWHASDSGEGNTKLTNVTKFCMSLKPWARSPEHKHDIQQVVYYQPGVGSSAISIVDKVVAGMLEQCNILT
jgi:uncharacterized protein (DUF2235 family)